MADDKRPQGKHVSETHGKRTVVVFNRGPRLQLKVNGAPKGTPRK
jgi:hypothetical protein